MATLKKALLGAIFAYIYYNIGIKNILKIFSKIFADSKIVATFATAFEKTTPRKRAEERKCKVLEKKVAKIFGSSKNLPYLCNPFAPLFEAEHFQTGSLIYWYILREKGM